MKLAALVLGFALSASNALADEVYGGVGISIQESKKKILIVEVNPAGPAARAGIVPGEFITAVDGLVVEGLKSDEVASLVRGTAGTTVTLSILDSTEHASRDVRLVREAISVTCLLKGSINLNVFGDINNGSISGTIGSRSIYWYVTNGYIQNTINGRRVSLQLSASNTGNLNLYGYINNSYVNWYGYNGWINGYQNCIPQ